MYSISQSCCQGLHGFGIRFLLLPSPNLLSKKLNLLLESLARELCPTFLNRKWLRSVHGVLEPLILVNEGEVSDLGQIWLFRNEFHAKLLKAPNLVISEVSQGVHFYFTVSWPKSNTSASFDQKWGF